MASTMIGPVKASLVS